MPARRPKVTANGPIVVRLVEATGDSTKSWDAAVLAAVKAAKVKAPVGVEVGRLWAEVNGPKLSRYHASVKVAYREVQRSAVRPSR
ncbi:MAG: dodecin domain-containing protein [Chloroflexi bacterium]|jgi:flavin-binding protein dodecin|nr:MAG: dodecin domain-containing protein [Chloroflexota bacterium]